MKKIPKSVSSLKNIDLQNFLYDISVLSFKNLKLQEFLREIHKRIAGLMSAKNFFVALHHKETDTYTFPYFADEYDSINSNEHLSLKNTLTDYVCKNGKAEIITSKREKEIFKNKFQIIGEYSPIWIGAPLLNPNTNEVIGVIALQDYKNENAYSLKDLKTLEIIARNIGLFIDRIRTHSTLQESEERFRTIFKEDRSIKIVIDQKTGKILEANDAAFEFYGYPDLTSKYIFEINMLPKQKVRIAMNKAIKKSFNKFIFKHKLASGEVRDVEVFSTSMKIDNSDVLFSIVFDITERNKIEAALKNSEQKLKEAEKIAHIGNFQINFQTGEITLSEETFNIFELDYKKDKVPSLNEFFKFVHPEDKKMLKEKIEKSLKQKNRLKLTYRIIRKDKKQRFIHSISKIKLSDDQKTKYMFGTIQDVTQSKLNEELLKQSKMKLEKAKSAKDKFFSIIAHDLRNPFQHLVSTTELLIGNLSDNADSDTKELAKIIHNSARHSYGLLEDLLLWSRSQSNSIEFSPQNIFLSDYISDEIKLNKNLAEKKGIKLSINIPSSLSVFADKNMLKFILRNLLTNSIKFTNRNGTITITAGNTKVYSYITVADTGIGMNSEQIKNLFKIGKQMTNLGTEKEKGTGLGLVLCNEFVGYHGGKISISSKVGKGSSFKCIFPYPNKK